MNSLTPLNCIIRVKRESTQYPIRLLDLYDPPDSLYIYGDIRLLEKPMIAIVGSREASSEGLKNAYVFAQGLARAGALILSGMAKGVDGAAHQAVIDLGVGHFTAAILGTGVNVVYPRQNLGLSQAVSRQGLLISEFPMGVGPQKWRFPKRNRLIAALSLGVVVIEATEKSGSLITAKLAAELGREVFALPGPIQHHNSVGCHQLIQQGAKLAFKPEDVLEELCFYQKPRFKPL